VPQTNRLYFVGYSGTNAACMDYVTISVVYKVHLTNIDLDISRMPMNVNTSVYT
jgi:hypothetical protein